MKDELLQKFDLDRLSDPSVRQEYEVLLRRADAVAASTMKAYGEGRLPICCHFVEADIFNARVRKAEDFYAIEINNSVPLLMMILFGALLSHEEMLPYLDHGDVLATDEILPAIADPLDFGNRATWQVALTKERSFAALTLADMCSFSSSVMKSDTWLLAMRTRFTNSKAKMRSRNWFRSHDRARSRMKSGKRGSWTQMPLLPRF